MKIEQIARVAYEANRAYCVSMGDLARLPWDEAPLWQKESAIKGVEFQINNLKKGITPSPSANHDFWVADKVQNGWKYGPVRDPDRKEHPCIVDFEDLPIEQRAKDYLFGAVVGAFWNSCGEPTFSR